jgi:HEAT repeat protein
MTTTTPADVAANLATMLFLLRDRPDEREEQVAAFRELSRSLRGGALDLRLSNRGIRVNGEPVSDALPLVAALRTHLMDRGVGELRLTAGVESAALLTVLRALVHPPGYFRSLHELTSTLDTPTRESVALAPPAPDVSDSGDWSVYETIASGPEVARQAADLHVPAGKPRDAERLSTLLAELEAAPDDPAVPERLNEVVRCIDGAVAREDWLEVLRAAATLVRSEAAAGAGSGTFGRAYPIAIRRALPRSVLERLARLVTNPDHRAAATLVLQRMGADATETLLGLLAAEEKIDDRRAFYAALREMTEGTELLVNMLTHDEWFVVRNVADLCGELRIEAAVPRLARHLTHPDERVRRSVAGALAKIGTAATIEPLRQALRDPSPTVRLQAILGVDERRGRGLAMTIAVRLDEETHPDILREMLLALGRIATNEAVQTLIRAAAPGRRLFNRKPVGTRLAAVEGLARAGTPAAAGALQSLLSDDDQEVRRAAQRALAHLND